MLVLSVVSYEHNNTHIVSLINYLSRTSFSDVWIFCQNHICNVGANPNIAKNGLAVNLWVWRYVLSFRFTWSFYVLVYDMKLRTEEAHVASDIVYQYLKKLRVAVYIPLTNFNRRVEVKECLMQLLPCLIPTSRKFVCGKLLYTELSQTCLDIHAILLIGWCTFSYVVHTYVSQQLYLSFTCTNVLLGCVKSAARPSHTYMAPTPTLSVPPTLSIKAMIFCKYYVHEFYTSFDARKKQIERRMEILEFELWARLYATFGSVFN